MKFALICVICVLLTFDTTSYEYLTPFGVVELLACYNKFNHFTFVSRTNPTKVNSLFQFRRFFFIVRPVN